MKKTLVFAVVVLCTSPAWALRFMGSPTTSGKSGLGLGFDWSHTQFDIKSDDVDGTAQLTNDIYFARLLWGVADWAEVSGMIAISDIEDNGEPSFHSGNDFVWGVGSKMRAWHAGPLDLGATFQFTSLRGDDNIAVDPFLIDTKLDAYIIELAVGPTYEVTRNISVYGGPFVHFIVGDLEGKSGGIKDTIDIEEEGSEFGGYIGATLEIVENTTASLEYHFTDDSYAIGVGLVHRFGPTSKPKPRVSSGRPWPKLKKVNTEPIQKEKLKTDADGKPVKDKDGNFIFVPVAFTRGEN